MTTRDRLWTQATPDQRRIALVGLASFLSRFYEKYDKCERNQRLLEQVKWLWAKIFSERSTGKPPIRVADGDQFIPDVDKDPAPDAAIGQSAAIPVFTATEAVDGNGEEPSDPWGEFDVCFEHASETEDDEAAYADGLRALRGLPVEQMTKGLDALNKMPRKSQHAKRVRVGFREAEAAVRAFLGSSEPMLDAARELKERLERIDVAPMLYRWVKG